MRKLQDFLAEAEEYISKPSTGDVFEIEIARDEMLISGYITECVEDGIVIELDDQGVALLEGYGYTAEDLTADQEGTMTSSDLEEAEYRGRKVPLGKPMQGDVKKFKVYVKKPNGNVVKVNFGDPNMRIKKSNPARRRSFRARHHCDNPGPRWKARYWSCRKW